MGNDFSSHGSLVLSGGADANKVRKHEHLIYFLFFFKHEHFNGTVITKMTSMYSI